MNFFADALGFILDPTNWSGEKGIAPRIADHVYYSGLALALALLVGLPLGFVIGHTGKGRTVVVAVSSAARALPSLGLVLFIVLSAGLQLWPVILVLAVLAVPPIMAGAYAGLESVSRPAIDAARSIGMTEWQILWRVEVPIGLPLIIGGVRSATLQVIATATIAAYVGLTGLGRFLIEGLALHNITLAIVGAILVAALALLADGLLALVQRGVTPRGVSRGETQLVLPRMRRALRRPLAPQ